MIKQCALGVSFFLLLSAQNAAAFSVPAWNIFNEPSLITPVYEKKLSALPSAGSVPTENIPWSDSYWQNTWGGISYRWNAGRGRQFTFRSPTPSFIHSLNEEQLDALSPAEKYDLLEGHYDYPLTHRVYEQVAGSASWEGICHGWSAAALLYVEPAPVELVNPDGIRVRFGSSDVKALLSYFYAWDAATPAHNLGLRCDGRRSPYDACGEDANAGAFHIILANEIGLKHVGFIADVDPSPEVWNQPVYAYESSVISERGPSRNSAIGTDRQVLVETKMTYSEESVSQWEPVSGTEKFRHTTVVYRYWLELNASGEIIGGSWASRKRPDFIWTKEKAPAFTGDLADLTRIYKPIH
jgi:hypothetical protein